MKIRLLSLLCLLAAAGLQAEVTFSGLHLSPDSRLLFNATSEVPGRAAFSTLFFADIPGASMRQLTFFPERIQMLRQTGQLQIQNRYGVFRSDNRLANLKPIDRFPGFASGRQIATGKIIPILESPDGRFLLYLEPVSAAFADLFMFDLVTGKVETVSQKVELSLTGPLADWSPDGKFFIYAKAGKLYYFSVDHYLAGRLLGEGFRSIGGGAISAVRWGNQNELYYISGGLVYQILGLELSTRSLYQNLLRIGRIVGKIPFDFDPNFDAFMVAPRGDKMLFNKGGRNLFLYYLQTDDYQSTGQTVSSPYLFLPRNTTVRSILWSPTNVITVLTQSIASGSAVSTIFRINLEEQTTAFAKTDDAGVMSLVLSPDGSRVALVRENSVQVREYQTWKVLKDLPAIKPIHAAWFDNTELVVAGEQTVDVVNSQTGTVRMVCLSQAEGWGFKGNTAFLKFGTRVMSFDGSTLLAATAFEVEEAKPANAIHRVYLENLTTGSYRNMVMVRNARTFGTVPLFQQPRRSYDAFPDRDDPVDFANFTHGSRIRRREVSIAFNAIDAVEGLTDILNILREYGVRATFFVNGDFIRRNPGAVRELAQSGHEIGSLFHANFDMTDSQFQVNKDFIKQGLARNEDDYFAATGREVSLLWHAPYYFINTDILEASREMNYIHVGRDVDSLDWVPRRDDAGQSPLYAPAAELLERLLAAKQPGSIISMTVGKPGDGHPDAARTDYLFQKLDLLLNELIARGYQVVPVSELMERSR